MDPLTLSLIASGVLTGAGMLGKKEKKKINYPAYDPTVGALPTLQTPTDLPDEYYIQKLNALIGSTQDPYQQSVDKNIRGSVAGGMRGSGIVEARLKQLEDTRAKDIANIQAQLTVEQQSEQNRNKLSAISTQNQAMMQRWSAQEEAKNNAYKYALNETELQNQSDTASDMSNMQMLTSLLGLGGDIWGGYMSSQGTTKKLTPQQEMDKKYPGRGYIANV